MKEFVEKLIERLKKYQIEYKSGFGSLTDETVFRVMENVIYIVKDLASEHNNGWIPCSERLPEDRQNVLITDSNGKIRQVAFNKWMYENPQYSHNIIPIAWQPLPAPYKKGE